MTNKPVNQVELDKWSQRWEDSLADLENVWLARSSYLAGDHLTIADLLGNCHWSRRLMSHSSMSRHLWDHATDHCWLESESRGISSRSWLDGAREKRNATVLRSSPSGCDAYERNGVEKWEIQTVIVCDWGILWFSAWWLINDFVTESTMILTQS